jgi:[acyl-carrier-protein] S-malonyltransferase
MQAAVPAGEGSMAAILGLDAEVLEDIIKGVTAPDVCEIANDNAPGQIVISGYKASVAKVMEQALAKGAKRCVELAVSAPFHSSLMAPAANVMRDALEAVPFNKPDMPVVPNRIAEMEIDPVRLRELLVEQVTGQVRWRESVTKMASMGVSTILEIGAGKVLTGLTKRITPDVSALSIGSVDDIENILKTL